jgi:hypothetical protein
VLNRVYNSSFSCWRRVTRALSAAVKEAEARFDCGGFRTARGARSETNEGGTFMGSSGDVVWVGKYARSALISFCRASAHQLQVLFKA